MMLVNDSEKQIPTHIKDLKNYFRQDKPFYCDVCKTTNSMLENCYVSKDKITFFLNCYDCGNLSSVNTTEKQIYQEMVRFSFTDKDEVINFCCFQVCFFYDYFSNLDSRIDARALVKRLEKQFRFWKLWYKVRYWRHNDRL